MVLLATKQQALLNKKGRKKEKTKQREIFLFYASVLKSVLYFHWFVAEFRSSMVLYLISGGTYNQTF